MNQASKHDLQLGQWLAGAALGAAAMYLFDPERGATRRAESGRQLRELGRQTGGVVDKVVQGMGRRANGAAGSAGAATAAARSAMTQGGAMRGAAMAGGGALGLYGLLAARSPLALLMALAGLTLLVRGGGARPLRALVGRSAPGRAIEVEKTIRIDAAPEQVYDQFASYDNFPRYMSNVIDVHDLGNARSHCVVKGPAGTEYAWDAVLTEQDRPRRLAWRSEPGADVEQSGAIRFEPFRNGTRVTVRMAYRPPAGAVGHAIASLLGRDPKRQMDDDLARMKMLIERGVIAQAAGQTGTQDKVVH